MVTAISGKFGQPCCLLQWGNRIQTLSTFWYQTPRVASATWPSAHKHCNSRNTYRVWTNWHSTGMCITLPPPFPGVYLVDDTNFSGDVAGRRPLPRSNTWCSMWLLQLCHMPANAARSWVHEQLYIWFCRQSTSGPCLSAAISWCINAAWRYDHREPVLWALDRCSQVSCILE